MQIAEVIGKEPEILSNPIIKAVAEAAAQMQTSAYLIGGYVRNLILDRPTVDLDFVCEGSGIALATATAELLHKGKEVHIFKSFGTAHFVEAGMDCEFVGARKESYRAESRKPIVEDGTLEDDQNRRDFTINAMAISLNAADFGALIDPFDGLGDIQRKQIRTPLAPDITFSDDPLRMFRAIRFASQLGFDITGECFESIKLNASRIEILSQERITDELNKIILSKVPSYGFKLLYHAGLLERIFPEFIALLGAENMEGKTHKDNFYHTLEVLDNVTQKTDDLWVRWAAILHDIAKPATKRFVAGQGFTFHGHEEKGARMVPKLFARFKLPMNEKMKKVEKLVRLHLRPISLVKDEVTDSAMRRLMVDAGEELEDLMMLCRADVTTKNPNKAKRYLANFDKVEIKMAEVEERDNLRNFQPVLTGNHIMEALGIGADKRVGVIKEEVRNAILDGKVENTLEACVPLMNAIAQRMGIVVK